MNEKTENEGTERIAKFLARAGVASRRDAEKLILAGRVEVNGKVVDSPAFNVSAADDIRFDGKRLEKPPLRLWLYHKPAGFVTTARDEAGRPTIYDNLPKKLTGIKTIGRLDLNSEGLLLLTNDGELKRRLELPETGWRRKYRVRAFGKADEASLEKLRAGITIEGEYFRPIEVSFDREQGDNSWYTVGLREGKNREIRRVFEAIGLQVNRLIRVSYGPFQLGNMSKGEVVEMRPKALRTLLGGLLPDDAPLAESLLDLTEDAPIIAPRKGQSSAQAAKYQRLNSGREERKEKRASRKPMRKPATRNADPRTKPKGRKK